jgi:hypothetical protein
MTTTTLHYELSSDPRPAPPAGPREQDDLLDLSHEAPYLVREGTAFSVALVQRLGMAPSDGTRLVWAVRRHDLMRQAVADVFMPLVRDLANRLRLPLEDAERLVARARCAVP